MMAVFIMATSVKTFTGENDLISQTATQSASFIFLYPSAFTRENANDPEAVDISFLLLLL